MSSSVSYIISKGIIKYIKLCPSLHKNKSVRLNFEHLTEILQRVESITSRNDLTM